MKKLIFTLLFMFSISIAPAIGTHYYYEWQKAIGIHQIEFETDKDLITIDLDKNQIITDYTTYDIIEPPTKWAWHKKYREKFCIFLCNDQNFNKVFVKLIEYKVLVQDMSCIETLARVNMICVDKTGTITEPTMKVVDVINFLKPDKGKYVLDVLNAVVDNMPPDNPTAKALKENFIKGSKLKVLKIFPFLSTTKWFGVEFENKEKFVIGAPEFILKLKEELKNI